MRKSPASLAARLLCETYTFRSAGRLGVPETVPEGGARAECVAPLPEGAPPWGRGKNSLAGVGLYPSEKEI